MQKTNCLCVIIPVHKPDITMEEEISLNACKRQLIDYDCYLVFPDGMNIKTYVSIFDNLLLKPVDSKWLSSLELYNKMKLSLAFYEMFRDYKFMLTYELDAYIFNANFNETKVFSFDFIGAPLFRGYLTAPPDAPFIPGCNSGFSIRNIESCTNVLRSLGRYRSHWRIYRCFLSKFPWFRLQLDRLTKGHYDIFLNGKLGFYFASDHINEDQVWSQIIPKLFSSFTVADSLSSLRFSFEHNPERLLDSNAGQLPLGCHGWPKYLNFWKKYIVENN